MSSTHGEDDDAQFGLTNIPFGIVSTQEDSTPKAATRLFSHVFRLSDLMSKGLMDSLDEQTTSALLKLGRIKKVTLLLVPSASQM
ncbi:hypothetical protein PMZ80_006015 [Knufia obscura]|uniref:Fumarylacetoacetase N-terminal domain-containing protein n=1 Tax=Knufia obscura TaxID=1635080 RepID=A0ABR0RN77_9EURO|nr:hypothetical protein PMZ80_006015 [Knufia obscura]